MPGSPARTSFTPGRVNVSPSDTQGGSRVPELGSLGSVRGALSNGRPYRDLPTIDDLGRGVVNGRLEPVGVGVHGVLHLCEETAIWLRRAMICSAWSFVMGQSSHTLEHL